MSPDAVHSPLKLAAAKGARAASSSAAWQEIRNPSWDHVWQSALRALHPWRFFGVHFFPQDQQNESNFDQANLVLHKLLWFCQKEKSPNFSEVFYEFLQHCKQQFCSSY
jgi:hypothetical protein